MTTPITEITTMTLRAMRAKLDEAAAIARAAEGCAVDGQPERALMIAPMSSRWPSRQIGCCRGWRS
jgi:hypothetical protein